MNIGSLLGKKICVISVEGETLKCGHFKPNNGHLVFQLFLMNLKVVENKHFTLNGLETCISQVHQPPFVLGFNSALKQRKCPHLGVLPYVKLAFTIIYERVNVFFLFFFCFFLFFFVY